MTESKPKSGKKDIPVRQPQKRTPAGIFDNLRKLPHPVEEILGLRSEEKIKDQPIPEQTILKTDQVQIEPSSPTVVHSEPSSKETKVKMDIAQNEPGSKRARLKLTEAPTYKSLNYLDDELMPTLGAAEQIVLRRLYRLSYGFNRNTTDPVSLNKLAVKCNLGDATVKRALKGLVERGLIQVHKDYSHDPNGGNKYTVLGSVIESLAQNEPGSDLARLKTSPINHDHDDLKNTHDHQMAVMTIYQQITNNNWTKVDQKAYEQIKNIPPEQIEQGIRRAFERAASRPGSLAYFIKEILNPSLGQSKATERQRGQMRRIIEQIRETHIGAGSEYRPEQFRQDVERACCREGLIFDLDLFLEIVGR